MALIKCPECGKGNVSESAVSCPDCGFAIQEYVKNEKVRLQAELKKELAKIDSLPKPEKPTISSVITSGNRWVWVVPQIIFVFFVCVLLYALIVYGVFDWGFTIPAVIFLIIALLGRSDIKEAYQNQLSIYEDFDGYKENQKKRVKENYDYKIKNIKPKIVHKESYTPVIVNSVLKCPVCGSFSVKKISSASRVMSVAMVGLASSKIGKQYECKNCGYKW